MRISFALALCCLCTLSFAADPAKAAIRKDLNVPAEELGSALQTLAKDYDFQVLYRTEIVKDLRTQGAVGTLTSDEALGRVLKGTGLSYKYLDANTVTIMPAPAGVTAGAADQSPTESSNGGGKKSSQDFRVAQVDQGKDSNAASIGNQASNSQESSKGQSVGLSEIVVTAQKKSERLQDVPVPVSVIEAEALVNNNETRLQDYYSIVPGLDLILDNRGSPALAVRGLTTTIYGNPTVATVIDDVPYSASTSAAFSWAATEFDPNELSQVETLRGPQGVLYGASSLGGLIKYVTVAPSTDGYSGRLQVSGNGIQNGDQAGYGASGAINAPLTDDLAIRASAFGRHDPGYIDNVLTGQHGVNSDDVRGARLSALWKVAPNWSVQAAALYQRSKTDGSQNVETNIGDLKQSYARGVGAYDRQLEAYSATVRGGFGSVDLTSLTSYIVSSSRGSFDVSTLPVPVRETEKLFGVPYDAWEEHNRTHKFNQEVRLTGKVGAKFDWLIGGFYTDETTDLNGGQYGIQGLSGAVLGSWYTSAGPVAYKEGAAFANFTYHFTDRFDVQVGGRYSENRQSFEQTTTFEQSSPAITPELRSQEHSLTYLVTPRFKISPEVMAYARLASGYRPGGINTAIFAGSGLPATFGPDKTQNYEIGIKGDFIDHKLVLDGSVYYIDWKDVQISILDFASTQTYTVNQGLAKSQGVELSAQIRPTDTLTVTGWAAYNDAVLTKAFPAASPTPANAGDRLPYSSRFSGSISLEQDFRLSGSVTGFAGAAVTYVGEREGEFGAERQIYPAYTKGDLRTGTRFDAWTLNLYVNNLADKRGVIGGGIGTLNPMAFTYIQPRSYGLSVARTF